MKYFATILILAFYTTSLHGQFEQVFPSQVLIENDCNAELINGTIELFGISDNPTEIYNIKSKLCEIQFFSNGQRISLNDTLLIPKDDKLKIQFEFKNYESEAKLIYYTTKFKKINEIRVNIGSYYITHEEVKSGRKKTINIKNNCSDSIKIYFPYGGTISGVTVHNSKKDTEFSKSISYGMGNETNFIKFAKSEIGKYYIRYGACHWGENFWLEILNE